MPSPFATAISSAVVIGGVGSLLKALVQLWGRFKKDKRGGMR